MDIAELKQRLPQLESEPEQLAQAVSGLDPGVLDREPAPGKWSIRQIAAHLADVELVHGHRLRQLLGEEKITFAPIDQDQWAGNLKYAERPIEESVDLYRALRRSNLRLLRGTKESDLQRSGYHPERKQQVTFAELVEYMCRHTQNHLAQIERAREAAKSIGNTRA